MFIAAFSSENPSPVGAACLLTYAKMPWKTPKLTPMGRLQTAPTGPEGQNWTKRPRTK